MKITQTTGFNKQNIKQVREEINKALAILENVGINASIGNITYEQNEVRTKLTLRPKQTSIKPAQAVSSNNDDHLNNFDFFLKYENQVVKVGGKYAKLVNFKRQNRKYPFIVEIGRSTYKVHREQITIG